MIPTFACFEARNSPYSQDMPHGDEIVVLTGLRVSRISGSAQGATRGHRHDRTQQGNRCPARSPVLRARLGPGNRQPVDTDRALYAPSDWAQWCRRAIGSAMRARMLGRSGSGVGGRVLTRLTIAGFQRTRCAELLLLGLWRGAYGNQIEAGWPSCQAFRRTAGDSMRRALGL